MLKLDKFFLKYEGGGEGEGGQIDPPNPRKNYPQKVQPY